MSHNDQIIEHLINQLRHLSKIIEVMSDHVVDQTEVLIANVPKCSKCHSAPETVVHAHLGFRMCDRCAAETVTKSGRDFVNTICNGEGSIDADVLGTLMDENAWEDLPHAQALRRVSNINALMSIEKESEH